MKTLLLIALFALTLWSRASELTVEYTAGWSPDYSLRVDFDTGKAAYLPKPEAANAKPVPIHGTVKNSKNVGEYVKALIQRIPEDNPGGDFGDDFPLYQITFVHGEFRKTLRIGSIHPPSAIHLNEGRTAQQELDGAKAFKDSIDSYLLCNLIGFLAEDLANAGK